MTAYIITGGCVAVDRLSPSLAEARMIIAADSGYNTARALGLVPDLLVGDLDSIDKSSLSDGELDQLEKLIVPSIKDDTDTQLAVDTAIERGADTIVLIGGLGGRLDHTLSSVFLLEYIERRGVNALITDGQNRARMLISDGDVQSLSLMREFKYLSLVSLSDASTVSVEGVFYPLTDAKLTRPYSYAVSNEITSEFALITLKSGSLLIIESDD